MIADMILLLLVTLAIQPSLTAAADDVTCASGLVYKSQGPGKHCIQSCKYPKPNPLYCPGSVPGCYCPGTKPIETCTLDGLPKCVASLDKCICPGGQSWQDCPCKKTCDNKKPKCRPCIPGCGCPSTKPIWHNGKCIKKNQCICPDKCATAGCNECNKCKCKNGRVKGCTEKACPDITTKEGFSFLLEYGCWRLCPSGKRCIFYSQCPDQFEPSCKSFPGGYCKECNKCTCNKDGSEVCSVNVQACSDALFQTVKLGCYRLIKGTCTYVNPCPEHPSEKNCCQCSTAGQMSCKECNECECVNGLKVCTKSVCPDPTDSNGCYIPRSYPGFPKGCFYVSPCPKGYNLCTTSPDYCSTCTLCSCSSRCLDLPRCPDPKLNSCYIYNDKLGHCEFVSPCPQCCCEGEMTCRECNECVCKEGKTVCSSKSCGNPIKKGCYIYNPLIGRCEFTIPCPPTAVMNSEKFCSNNPSQAFCRHDDCNVCNCPASYPGPIACTKIGCLEPVGCWRPQDGYCKFLYPCPN